MVTTNFIPRISDMAKCEEVIKDTIVRDLSFHRQSRYSRLDRDASGVKVARSYSDPTGGITAQRKKMVQPSLRSKSKFVKQNRRLTVCVRLRTITQQYLIIAGCVQARHVGTYKVVFTALCS